MNILHIWDQAAVACVLAKNQTKSGHNAKVIRSTGYDPFGIYDFYKEFVTFVPEQDFLDLCLEESEKSDIIHIHSRTDALFHIKNNSKGKNNIVMHFHGTDLRGLKRKYKLRQIISNPKLLFKNYRVTHIRQRNNLRAEQLADKILYSTPDLRQYLKKDNSILINIPIDTEHFKKDPNVVHNDDSFTFFTEAISNMRWIENHCRRNGIMNLKVIDRTRHPINYSEMPNFLKQFGIYVDIRYVNDNVLPNLSTTALQSLACGLKVINYDLELISELPLDRIGFNAAKKVQEIYEELI